MPALTRRRERDRHQESWHIYFGDFRAGWIGERAGIPHGERHWGWACGFYPGSEPGECTTGAAATFDEARAGFMRDWEIFLAKRTAADFDTWRCQTAATAWKYAMWDAGCKLPTQTKDGWTTCFCGAIINNNTSGDHMRVRHMEEAAN